MGKDYTIHVGSVGGGLSCSPDGGETWNPHPGPTALGVQRARYCRLS